jgi:hypothetical protein
MGRQRVRGSLRVCPANSGHLYLNILNLDSSVKLDMMRSICMENVLADSFYNVGGNRSPDETSPSLSPERTQDVRDYRRSIVATQPL